MFQRRGVEDDVRRRFADESSDPVAVADVAKQGAARKVGPAPGQLQIDGVEIELRVIEERQVGRREIRDLADQLAPDAAPGAGHQDALAFDQAPHGDAIQGRLRAAQQILDGEWLDFKLVGDAALEIGEAGQPGQGHPQVLRRV